MLWKLEISSCIDGPVMLYTDLSFTSTATKVKSAFINILIHNTHCTAQKMEVISKHYKKASKNRVNDTRPEAETGKCQSCFLGFHYLLKFSNAFGNLLMCLCCL